MGGRETAVVGVRTAAGVQSFTWWRVADLKGHVDSVGVVSYFHYSLPPNLDAVVFRVNSALHFAAALPRRVSPPPPPVTERYLPRKLFLHARQQSRQFDVLLPPLQHFNDLIPPPLRGDEGGYD